MSPPLPIPSLSKFRFHLLGGAFSVCGSLGSVSVLCSQKSAVPDLGWANNWTPPAAGTGGRSLYRSFHQSLQLEMRLRPCWSRPSGGGRGRERTNEERVDLNGSWPRASWLQAELCSLTVYAGRTAGGGPGRGNGPQLRAGREVLCPVPCGHRKPRSEPLEGLRPQPGTGLERGARCGAWGASFFLGGVAGSRVSDLGSRVTAGAVACCVLDLPLLPYLASNPNAPFQNSLCNRWHPESVGCLGSVS